MQSVCLFEYLCPFQTLLFDRLSVDLLLNGLCVFSAVSSSAEYGFHFSTALMYEHNLDRMAANMTYGEFGGVQGK